MPRRCGTRRQRQPPLEVDKIGIQKAYPKQEEPQPAELQAQAVQTQPPRSDSWWRARTNFQLAAVLASRRREPAGGARE